jgi:nucleotide-binding universal stress UspA family protein
MYMGSHGRSGLSELLLGSQTSKMLSQAHIPVLVHR